MIQTIFYSTKSPGNAFSEASLGRWIFPSRNRTSYTSFLAYNAKTARANPQWRTHVQKSRRTQQIIRIKNCTGWITSCVENNGKGLVQPCLAEPDSQPWLLWPAKMRRHASADRASIGRARDLANGSIGRVQCSTSSCATVVISQKRWRRQRVGRLTGGDSSWVWGRGRRSTVGAKASQEAAAMAQSRASAKLFFGVLESSLSFVLNFSLI